MKNLLLKMMVILSLALVLSCGNDDEAMSSQTCNDGIQNGDETGIDCGGACGTCETSVEEDKNNVEQSFEDLTSCAMDVSDSRTVSELFNNFLNMTDGEVMNEEWVNDITAGLEDVFDFEEVETNSSFDLAYHAGTYAYDASGVSWSKANDVSDRVILQFPSEANGANNNVVFILDQYSDQVVTMDGESISLPNSMHALMTIDGARAFEITVDEVSYSDDSQDQLPTALSAAVFMDPINMDIELTSTSSTAYEMGMSITNTGLCDVSLNTQFELADDDMGNMGMSSFNQAAVQVNLGQLSFRTMGDLASLLAMEEPTEAQINSLADLDVFFSCLLYTSPSPRDATLSRMPSSA